MALNTRLSSDHADHIMAFLESKFLDFVRKELLLVPMGKKKVLPQHMGKTVKWNQWTVPSSSTTALTEANPGDGISLSSSNYTATLAAYGQYVSISDFLQMSAINDTMNDAQELLAYVAALSLDQLVRNELDTNGTQRYADPANNSSKANVESGSDQIASSDLKLVLKALRAGNIPTFENGLYNGIIHPYMEFSLLSETAASSFIILSANNGSAGNVINQAEIGKAFGINLMRSTNIRADATSTNTYGNIFVGRDAFGVVDLASAGLKMIVKETGTSGAADPLDQIATVGYKVYFATKQFAAARTQIVWAYGS